MSGGIFNATQFYMKTKIDRGLEVYSALYKFAMRMLFLMSSVAQLSYSAYFQKIVRQEYYCEY